MALLTGIIALVILCGAGYTIGRMYSRYKTNQKKIKILEKAKSDPLYIESMKEVEDFLKH